MENWVDIADGYDFVEISHGGISHNSTGNVTDIKNLVIRFKKSITKSEKSKALKSDDNAPSSNDDATKALGKITDKRATDNTNSGGNISYAVSFPVVSFTDLAFDGDYYSARKISADTTQLDFTISETGQSDSKAVGNFNNFFIENVKWARLPQIIENKTKPVSTYFPLFEALVDISFDRAKLAGMSMVQEMSDPQLKITTNYGPMEVGKTDRGNFSTMRVQGMEMQMGDENTSPSSDIPITSFRMGEILATDYNYRTLLDNLAPGKIASGDNDPYQNLLGEMIFDDIAVTVQDAKFSLGRVLTKDVDIRPPKIDVLGEIDRLVALEVAKQQKADGKNTAPIDDKRIIGIIASVYGMLRLGEFELSDMKFVAPHAGNGKMDSYRVADLSASGLGEFSLGGVNFTGNDGEIVNLDRLALLDLKFPSIQSLMNLKKSRERGDFKAVLEAIPTLANFFIKGMEIRIPGSGEFSMAQNNIRMSNFIGPVPTNVDIKIKDVKMPVSQLDREPREIFSAMGFENVEFSYYFKGKWEEATKLLLLQSGSDMKDAGIVDINMVIGEIPRSVFENPQSAQSAVAFATLDSANVTFEDRSIVDKGLKVAGAQQGVNAETMKAQVIGLLPIMLQVLGKPAFVDEVTAAVKEFLDTNGSIAANIAPATPVLILQLMGAAASAPGAVIDLLNIKVQAN